ncbi:hypothetical protein NEUTE1DRAFT_62600, partial [Neurospora tetrasperma FGSC 2508]
MAELNENEPFHWDVERVVKELCTPERTWDAPAPHKLPDPERLAFKLRELDIDGETLLMYPDEYGWPTFWEMLGIKKLAHHLSIGKAIKQFRETSTLYYRQKRDIDLPKGLLSTTPAIKPDPLDPSEPTPPLVDNSIPEPTAAAIDGPVSEPSPAGVGNAATDASPAIVNNTAVEANSSPESPEKRGLGNGLRQDTEEASRDPERPLKKRRIAPTIVSTVAPAQARSFIPTEGDITFLSDANFDRFLDVEDSKFSYLGSSALRSEDIASLPYNFESDDDGDDKEASEEFTWVRSGAVPPARALQVARVMRKFFRKRSPFVNEDEEVVLDFGEDDDGMSVDSETYREYEQEEQERKAHQSMHGSPRLSKVQAEEAIEDAIQRLEVSWETIKKPKFERRAWKIWQDARRNRTRLSLITFAKNQLRSLEPPKPSTLPRLKPEPKKERETLASDEELLTSDSEEEDQFIEDDLSSVDHMIIDPKETIPSTRPSTPVRPLNPSTETNHIPEEEENTIAQPSTVDDETGAVNKVEPTTPQRIIHTIPAEPIEILSSPSDVDQLANLPPLTDTWKEHIQPLIDRAATGISRIDVDPDSISLILALLFLTYSDFSEGRLKIRSTTLRCVTCQKLNREYLRFGEFFEFLQNCIRYFRSEPKSPTPMEMTSAESPEATQDIPMDITSESEHMDTDLEELSSQFPLSSAKKGRRPKHDEKAKKLRVDSKALLKQMDERRKLLRAKLAETGSVPSDKSRLIINETKESDDLPLIYVHEEIGGRIKDHQIDGVRFMWDQIVVDSNSRQGCLLAHTMGLGKTMQVITLLVAIAEASQSDDPRVVAQIPKDLRVGRPLILCPSGLVENWIDEICKWAPKDILGNITKIDAATVPPSERVLLIKGWARSRGVLVMGYELFRSLVSGKEDNVAELLHSSPSIVICDEAHRFKNKTSKLYAVVQDFHTMSRIATTGSPLTRNAIVAPKVNRKDIQVLVDELPQKREFILTIQMTKVQRDAYREYLETAQRNKGNDLYRTACVWGLIASLKLLLAHPKIFKSKMEERLNPDSDENDEPLDLSRDTLRNVLAKVSIRGIDDIVHSTKVTVLLQILKECKQIGDKVLVFSQSIPTLNFLQDLFKQKKINYKRLDGKTPVSQRQAAVKEFNAVDSLDVYLISTRAGGVGLNIPGANRVVLFDFGFTPAEEQQAVGRAYRIGQEKKVFVYHLKVGGTYETAIHNLAIFKRQLSERVVDKKKPIPSSTRMREYFITPPENLEQKDLSAVKGLDPEVLDKVLASAECSSIIREIDSTETFEREEVYEFTAEQHRELNKQIELEELRINNPEEYKRQMSTGSGFALPSLPPNLGTPISTGGEDKHNPATPGSAPSIPLSAANNISASTQAGAPIPRVASTAIASQTVASSPSPANGQVAALNPILGTNTHYKVAEAPRKPATLKAPEIIPKPRKPEDTTPKLLEALGEVHRKLRDDGYDMSVHPQDLVMQINSECDRQDMAAGTLPRMDKLRSLCKAVTESTRFGEALLAGYLTPNEVVAMGMAQMKAKIAEFQTMTDDCFKQELW